MSPLQADPVIEHGVMLFDEGLSCAESVALAGKELLGLETQMIPRMASGFAAGFCRTQSVCGAVAGAVLVLGAAYGRDRREDDRTRLVSEVQALTKGFRERFGSDTCFALTGLDFNAPGAFDVYTAQIHSRCGFYVRYVLEELCRATV